MSLCVDRSTAKLEHMKVFFILSTSSNHSGLVRNTPTLDTLGRIGSSVGCSDLWDGLGGQALVVIGRWYSRKTLNNPKQRLSTQTIPEIVTAKACTRSP